MPGGRGPDSDDETSEPRHASGTDTTDGWTTDRDTGFDDRQSRLDLLWLWDRIRWLPGTLYGVAAFAAGYVATWALLSASSDVLSEASTPGHLAVGWVFQGTHHVAVASGGSGQNAVAQLYAVEAYAPIMVPSLVFYLLPVVVLVAAGYLATSRLSAPPRSRRDAALAGASVFVGYLATTLVTSVTVFSFAGGFGAAAPRLSQAVVIMGFAYPVTFGAVGGYLSRR